MDEFLKIKVIPLDCQTIKQIPKMLSIIILNFMILFKL
jgi:hypothetical protein